jgi:hypothetical protein
MVDAINQLIDRPDAPSEKFRDPTHDGHVSWIHRLAGGRVVLVTVPMAADSDSVGNAVEVLVDTVLGLLP